MIARHSHTDALLLVGHGTRDEAGVSEFLLLTEEVRRLRPDCVVEPCFLELARPTIDEGIARAVERGARHLTIVPLLLFAAGHAQSDVPDAVALVAASYTGLTTRQAPHLGCAEQIVELSALRYRQAWQTASDSPPPASETLLLMVGRGSHDPTANAEMAKFARLRWECTPCAWLEVAYAAMTEPSLDRALEIAARLPFGNVVVQPHLLFHGQLHTGIFDKVTTHAYRHTSQHWLTTEPLGPHRLLAEAVIGWVSW